MHFHTLWIGFLALVLGCARAPDDAVVVADVPEMLAPLSGGRVAWHSWAERDSARVQHRPIMLFLYSQRSFWCRDLVAHGFEDAELAQMVNRIALPVWVDADRRPDVFERYSMGGLPTVAFLTADGRWITGSTYLDAQDLEDLLRHVFILYDNPQRMETLEKQRAELVRRALVQARRDPKPELPPNDTLWARVIDSVRVAIARGDAVGSETLLLPGVAGREVLAQTARDGDGLFFLSARTPDGAVVDREKHLAANAGLLMAFSAAGADVQPVAHALGTALLDAFALPGDSLLCAGFAGFDVAGQQPRDPAIYSGWNGLAASGFAALYQSMGERRFLQAGERLLSGLVDRFRRADGLFVRMEEMREPVFLEDQALIARAALDVFEAGGKAEYLRLARDLADGVLRTFEDASGGLRDRAPESGEAVMPAVDRWTPSGNGVAVQVLVRLSKHTGEQAYRDAAGRILRALIGPHIDRAAYLGALNRGLFMYLEMGSLF